MVKSFVKMINIFNFTITNIALQTAYFLIYNYGHFLILPIITLLYFIIPAGTMMTCGFHIHKN
ncbi:MAG: hypothetical protein C4581_07390 [Nitrospiraceae bacterium]|nr:MAG: hypothetical protein C4581_07390 [Nitrospiraceae bacterium]